MRQPSVKHWEWATAQDCLDWLFENHASWLCPGCLHLWQGSFATLGGGNLTGGYKWISKAQLEGRAYKVSFHNDSVGIEFYDQVFIDRIPNRSYPQETRCIKSRLPFC